MTTRILAFISVLAAAPLGMAQTVPQYTITTVAGNNGDGSGYSGDSGPATSAQLSNPIGIAVDGAATFISPIKTTT